MDIWKRRLIGIRIFFFVQGVIQLVDTQECSQKLIDDCIQPMQKYHLENSTLFPQFNKIQLTALCDEYTKVESCLLPIKPTCNLFQRRHYEGIELAFRYICGAGFEIYGRNYDCFGNVEARVKVRACNATFQERAVTIQRNAQYMSSNDVQSENCKRMNDYLFCIRDEVASVCGGEAGDWQHEVNKKSISPVLNEMNCEIWRPPLNGGEIAAIVICGIVFIILVGVLIFYCTCNVYIFRKNKLKYAKEQNKVNVSSNGHVPPSQQRPSSQQQRPSIVPTLNLPPRSPPPLQRAPSRGSLRSTRSDRGSMKLNLSFADQHGLDISYETLPPSYTLAIEGIKRNKGASNLSEQDTDNSVPDTRLDLS